MAAALLPAALLAVSMTNIPAVASTIRNVAAVSYDKVSENNVAIQEGAAESGQPASGTDADDGSVKKAAEKMPEYPGGLAAMMKSLIDEIKYPESALKEGISGKVVVKFIVNTDGTMSDFEIVRSQNEELDAEAIRAIKAALKEKWTPGMENGKPVRCTFTLPVNFSLKSDSK